MALERPKDCTPTDIKNCSGLQKTECLLDKKCLPGYLVYNALVDRLDTSKTKHFNGTCEKNFKERYSNHIASYRNKNKEKSTELLKASKAHLYVCGSRKCKLTIVEADPETLLNTRDEPESKCWHMNKFTLRRFKQN